MHVLRSWPDEHAVLAEDARRRRGDEVDLGGTWRAAGSPHAWVLTWLRETGELYLCRGDSLAGGGAVHLLSVQPDEAAVDALLSGWRDARDSEDGLGWLAARLPQLDAA